MKSAISSYYQVHLIRRIPFSQSDCILLTKCEKNPYNMEGSFQELLDPLCYLDLTHLIFHSSCVESDHGNKTFDFLEK